MRNACPGLLLGIASLWALGDAEANAALQRCGTIKPEISQATYGANRPADFFELCVSNDAEVCSDIEKRLNTFTRTSTIHDPITTWYVGFNIAIDGWSPSPMPPPTFRDSVGVLAPRVVLDLNGDRQQEVLYQTRWFLSSQPFVKIVWSVSAPTGEPEIEADIKRKTDPTEPGVLVGDVFPENLLGEFRRRYGWTSTDITESNGRYYVVVVRPWTSDALPTSEVFIAAMDDARTGRLVCRFESRYRVMRVGPR